MIENPLAISFGETLTAETLGCITDFAEIGLDSVIEDGLLKEIPFLSTAVSVYRIGQSIRERNHIAKLAAFLTRISEGILSEDDRKRYQEKFQTNTKFRDQELEYILILIDRYINKDKAKLLATLYLAYLDGKIDWKRFAEFSEIIDRLLPADFDCLFEFMCHGGVEVEKAKIEIASVLRLLAVGFVSQEQPVVNALLGMNAPRDSMEYLITGYGREFVKIFEADIRTAHTK